MEQSLPIEELARQRLDALVSAYSLFTKNLMDEGLDREKVKSASDKAWSTLGEKAGAQMKSLFGGADKMTSAQQAGTIAMGVHAIEGKIQATEDQIRVECSKCPWKDAADAFGLPSEWRLCSSGHEAFSQSMHKTMNPGATVEMGRSMALGDQFCEEIIKF